jgi:hypothetical protein
MSIPKHGECLGAGAATCEEVEKLDHPQEELCACGCIVDGDRFPGIILRQKSQ